MTHLDNAEKKYNEMEKLYPNVAVSGCAPAQKSVTYNDFSVLNKSAGTKSKAGYVNMATYHLST
jgi:hypothetical protein